MHQHQPRELIVLVRSLLYILPLKSAFDQLSVRSNELNCCLATFARLALHIRSTRAAGPAASLVNRKLSYFDEKRTEQMFASIPSGRGASLNVPSCEWRTSDSFPSAREQLIFRQMTKGSAVFVYGVSQTHAHQHCEREVLFIK